MNSPEYRNPPVLISRLRFLEYPRNAKTQPKRFNSRLWLGLASLFLLSSAGVLVMKTSADQSPNDQLSEVKPLPTPTPWPASQPRLPESGEWFRQPENPIIVTGGWPYPDIPVGTDVRKPPYCIEVKGMWADPSCFPQE